MTPGQPVMTEARGGTSTHEPAACHWLAIAGGCAAAAVGALFFRGWVVTGHRLDVVPALVAALVTSLSIHVLGRVEGRWQAVYAGGSALLGVGAGYCLAWDLFGLVAAQSGDAGGAGGWSERLMAAWTSRTFHEQWINGLSYVLAPCLAMFIVALGRRGARYFDRDPARPDLHPAAPFEAPGVAARWRWRLAAAAWSLGVLSFFLFFGGGERSGFTRLSFPCEPFHATYPLTGFNYLRQGVPVMAEEVPALEQVGWFSGEVRSDNNFRFLRAGYAFLAVHFAPVLGGDRALLGVNVLSWCACVASAWVLCRHVFRSEAAAAIAACLASTGIGLAIHLHSFGPHLAGFALYFSGVTWLAVSGITIAAHPWRWHCATGLGLGLIGVVYNVGPMLAAVYLWNGFARQRWRHLAGGAILAFSIRPIWRFILPALGINVVDTEGEYLTAALSAWAAWWEAGLGTFLWHAAQLTLESATACDSPVVVALGLMAIIVAPRSWRDGVFGVPVLAAPVLASTVFGPAAEVRGYIVYGMTLWLYCCLGGWLARGLHRGRAAAIGTCFLLGLTLASQSAWCTAHLWGWLGPAKTYFLGWDDGWPVLRHRPTHVVSLTGAEAAPVAFGGSATLVEAGAVDMPSAAPVPRKSRILAWLSRFPLLFACVLFGAAALPARASRRKMALLALVLLLGGGEASFRTLHSVPAPFQPAHGAAVAPRAVETLRLQIASSGLQPVDERFQSGQYDLGLYLQSSSAIRLRLRAGGREVPLEAASASFYRMTNPDDALAALHAPEWELTIQNVADQAVWLTGWQRRSLPARDWTGAEGRALPAVELRLVRTDDGYLEAAAF